MLDIHLERTRGDTLEFVALAGRLTNFLAELNGERNSFYAQFNKVDDSLHAVIALVDGSPVACGAFRWVDDGVVEIKRMFSDPDLRGQGLGRQVLSELEKWAAELGAHRAVLETSKRLLPAVGLYQTSGYEVIDNYGPYVGVDDSVCMEKVLRN